MIIFKDTYIIQTRSDCPNENILTAEERKALQRIAQTADELRLEETEDEERRAEIEAALAAFAKDEANLEAIIADKDALVWVVEDGSELAETILKLAPYFEIKEGKKGLSVIPIEPPEIEPYEPPEPEIILTPQEKILTKAVQMLLDKANLSTEEKEQVSEIYKWRE